MKNVNWKSILKAAPTRYLRELSIVIIGVMITLFITNIVSAYSKQKEVKESLKLIALELQENINDIQEVEKKLRNEQRIYSILIKNLDDITQIPVDTLKNNAIVVGGAWLVADRRDAYEVFKSSSLMQYIEDKEFLKQLTNTYKTIEMMAGAVAEYTKQKEEAIHSLLQDMPQDKARTYMTSDMYTYFNITYSHKRMQLFLYTSKGIFDWDIFDDCYTKLNSAIEEINKRI